MTLSEHPMKDYPTIGCCGCDCGLCPRYYAVGSSRCPGCCGSDFFNKNSSCVYIACCVKQKKLEVCALCDEFLCSKFESWLESRGKKAKYNLNFIRTEGLEKFLVQQRKRIVLLEKMLKNFDDGSSTSFYCIASALLPITDLETSLEKTKQKLKAEKTISDTISRSKILEEFLNESAARNGVELRLRRKAEADCQK